MAEEVLSRSQLLLQRWIDTPRDEVPILDLERLYVVTTEADAIEDVLPNEPLPLELLHVFTTDAVENLRRIVTIVAKLDKFDELMLVDDRDLSREQRADFLLKNVGHAIKGAAANLGLWRLSLAAMDLEHQLKEVADTRDGVPLSAASPEDQRRNLSGVLEQPRAILVNLWNELEVSIRYLEDDMERDFLGPMGFSSFDEVPDEPPEDFFEEDSEEEEEEEEEDDVDEDYDAWVENMEEFRVWREKKRELTLRWFQEQMEGYQLVPVAKSPAV